MKQLFFIPDDPESNKVTSGTIIIKKGNTVEKELRVTNIFDLQNVLYKNVFLKRKEFKREDIMRAHGYEFEMMENINAKN